MYLLWTLASSCWQLLNWHACCAYWWYLQLSSPYMIPVNSKKVDRWPAHPMSSRPKCKLPPPCTCTLLDEDKLQFGCRKNGCTLSQGKAGLGSRASKSRSHTCNRPSHDINSTGAWCVMVALVNGWDSSPAFRNYTQLSSPPMPVIPPHTPRGSMLPPLRL